MDRYIPKHVPISIAHTRKYYPQAIDAIAWMEIIICQCTPEDPETSWDLMMRVEPPMSVQVILELLKETVLDADISDVPTKNIITQQLNTPDFLNYLKGKMGCV